MTNMKRVEERKHTRNASTRKAVLRNLCVAMSVLAPMAVMMSAGGDEMKAAPRKNSEHGAQVKP